MKITATYHLNVDTKAVIDKVNKAVNAGLKDVVVLIANDSIKNSPVLTGNNARSIMFEVGPGGEIAKQDNQGAVYSTSGYGGFLETGTVIMAARPYMNPALMKFFPKLPELIKAHL